MAKEEEGSFKKFDSVLFTDIEMLNAVAFIVASAIKSTFIGTNRRNDSFDHLIKHDFFNYMKKHKEEMHHYFLLLKFIYSLMEQRINEIKRGKEARAKAENENEIQDARLIIENARLLLAIDDISPDLFIDALWKAEIWKKGFKEFCLSKGMSKKDIKEQFKIFDRDWPSLNDEFLATFNG